MADIESLQITDQKNEETFVDGEIEIVIDEDEGPQSEPSPYCLHQ